MRETGENSIRATQDYTLIPWWDALGNAMRMIWSSWIQTSEDLRNFHRFALEFWDLGRGEHGRERGGHWQLREVILERWGTKGYAEYDLEKFKVRNFRRMFGTFAECPELPQNVRNFRRNLRNFRRFPENSAEIEIWADFWLESFWDWSWIDIDWDVEQRLRISGLEHSHNK